MASGNTAVKKAARGETYTATNNRLATSFQAATSLVKLHYLFLSPLVVFSIPAAALLGQSALVAVVIAVVGSYGMLLHRRLPAQLGSLALLGILVWGKLAADLLKTSPLDTAVLLAQFIAVIAFMEGSNVVLGFDTIQRGIVGDDEISRAQRAQLAAWAAGQLSHQGKLALGTVILSLGLLPLANATSISSNELVFSGSLVLVATVVLLFLVTYRREPETR
jgi:hypothetical protein